MKVVQHTIKDNQLRINNKEYVGLDIEKVIVGVENTERQEIVQDPTSGLNYSRNAVEGQEVYKLSTQKHHPWFILDLETGSRGWYPGCIIRGDILGTDVAIKEEPNEESTTLGVATTAEVEILNIDAIDQEPYEAGWYKVKYNVTGYVKESEVSNLRYADPFK